MPGAKLQQNNPANDPTRKPVRGHSHFELNHSNYFTHNYAYIQPHLAVDVVPKDEKVQYRHSTEVDTMNGQAPTMCPVSMKTATFYVPLRAMIPEWADLLVDQPLSGDDVQANKIAPCLNSSCLGYIKNHVQRELSVLDHALQGKYIVATGTSNADYTYSNVPSAVPELFIKNLFVQALNVYKNVAPFLSAHSLAAYSGFNFHNRERISWNWGSTDGKPYSFDQAFEVIFDYLKNVVVTGSVTVARITKTNSNTLTASTKSVYFDKRLSEPDFAVAALGGLTLSWNAFLEFILNDDWIVIDAFLQRDSNIPAWPTSQTLLPALSAINYQLPTSKEQRVDRLAAYQLAVAQFFTDDAVDYVFDATLWRQNMLAIYDMMYTNTSANGSKTYLYNGMYLNTDALCGTVIEDVFNLLNKNCLHPAFSVAGTTITPAWAPASEIRYICALYYFWNLFTFQRSLRYRDYFVGSRPTPLAGTTDITSPVVSSAVSVVDITKNIQIQRFKNQVNRIGRRAKEYAQGIFGASPYRDNRSPIFLSATSDVLGAEETANTGADQLTKAQTRTSQFRGSSSRFIFETDIQEFGSIVSVTFFECVRPYEAVRDRSIENIDRFQMFNPYMQHIGDQKVDSDELGVSYNNNTQTFGYKLRYSEYKMCVDHIAGGFQDFLPGYCFPNRISDLIPPDTNSPASISDVVISPNFIRPHSYEFDKFFSALTGNTFAKHFHFIVRHDNLVSTLRPMEAAPSIL